MVVKKNKKKPTRKFTLSVSKDIKKTKQKKINILEKNKPGFNLKRTVCNLSLSIITNGGRINIIYDYLKKVLDENERLSENNLPSFDEIEKDLKRGIRQLLTFNEKLIGSPLLNNEEQNYLYLSSEDSKKEQIKKDDWLHRFSSNDNKDIYNWLIEIGGEPVDDDPPLTPRKRDEVGDKWEDISVIFNNVVEYLQNIEQTRGVTELLKNIPTNLPKTHISINVGKIEDMDNFIIGIAEALLDRFSNCYRKILNILFKAGLTTLKISGYTIAISTKFITDLIVGILRNNINTKIWNIVSNVLTGYIDCPFIISNNKDEIQSKIDNKYILFLSSIVIKTIFMLGNLVNDPIGSVTPTSQIRNILNNGIEILNSYITDKDYKFPNIKVQVNTIMEYMKKYTEWYLLRKTVIFNTNDNKKIFLLENKKEPREMNLNNTSQRQGSAFKGWGQFGALLLNEGYESDDMDVSANISKRKKNTKRKFKLKKKSKKKSKKRKKI